MLKRIRMMTVVVALLLVCVSFHVMAAGTVVYEEKFDNEDAFFADWELLLGSAKLEDGALHVGEGSTFDGATPEQRAMFLNNNNLLVGDFDLEVEVAFKETGSDDGPFINFSFRKAAPSDMYWDSGYMIQIRKGGTSVALWKLAGGANVDGTPITMGGIADVTGGVNRVKIEARGARIKVYLNDEVVIDWTDLNRRNQYLEGFFGIYTEASYCVITQYKVTEY